MINNKTILKNKISSIKSNGKAFNNASNAMNAIKKATDITTPTAPVIKDKVAKIQSTGDNKKKNMIKSAAKKAITQSSTPATGATLNVTDGQGGMLKNMASKVGDVVKNTATGITNTIKSGVTKYKNFKEKEDKLDAAAKKIQGNVSSNQANVDEFVKIKRKLRKEGNY